MRHVILLAVLALVPLGGCHPIKLETCNRLRMDSPVAGQVKMEYETPPAPTRTNERVVAMPLDGSRKCADGPKVALIDVDGLLLNQNMAGLASVGDNPVSLFKEKLD